MQQLQEKQADCYETPLWFLLSPKKSQKTCVVNWEMHEMLVKVPYIYGSIFIPTECRTVGHKQDDVRRIAKNDARRTYRGRRLYRRCTNMGIQARQWQRVQCLHTRQAGQSMNSQRKTDCHSHWQTSHWERHHKTWHGPYTTSKPECELLRRLGKQAPTRRNRINDRKTPQH